MVTLTWFSFSKDAETSVCSLTMSSSPRSSEMHTSWNHMHRAAEDPLGFCWGTQAEVQWNGATVQYGTAWPPCELLPPTNFCPFPDDFHSRNVSFTARNDDFQGTPDEALRRSWYSRDGHDLWWESKDSTSFTSQWNPNDVPHQNANNVSSWPPNSSF